MAKISKVTVIIEDDDNTVTFEIIKAVDINIETKWERDQDPLDLEPYIYTPEVMTDIEFSMKPLADESVEGQGRFVKYTVVEKEKTDGDSTSSNDTTG